MIKMTVFLKRYLNIIQTIKLESILSKDEVRIVARERLEMPADENVQHFCISILFAESSNTKRLFWNWFLCPNRF